MMTKIKYNQKAFSLVETLIYIFITAMLLVTISSLVLANFNIRKQLKTSDLIYNDARFIMGQLNNKIHNVTVFDDVSPSDEQIIFYPAEGNHFFFIVEDGDLIYKEIEQVGGLPTIEHTLNSERVQINQINLTPISDWQGTANKGVLINLDLSTGTPGDTYGYLHETFEIFISIR
jgi:hypothetical protein